MEFPLIQNKQSQKGFTVLFAVLLSSILLIVGLSVFNISFKELILSSSARDSVFAFYAADSGSECALYWDLVQNKFPTTTTAKARGLETIICNNQVVAESAAWNFETGNDYNKITFQINYPETALVDGSNNYACSIVSVRKATNGDTVIESKGYNTCQQGNPRRLERALRVLYTK